jgi:hypothetical protein
VYNYAISGASCSSAITPRNNLYSGIIEDELPMFMSDKSHKASNGSAFLSLPVNHTLYAVWIGTNDLGVNAFITDSQSSGKIITDYVECVYSVFDKLYQAGARRFVLMNVIPLNLLPMYAMAEHGGLSVDKFWPWKPNNLTAVSERMHLQVASVNYAFKYQTPYEVRVSRRYAGAEMALFDVHGLVRERGFALDLDHNGN